MRFERLVTGNKWFEGLKIEDELQGKASEDSGILRLNVLGLGLKGFVCALLRPYNPGMGVVKCSSNHRW